MSPSRRRLLRTGGAALSVALAGCLSGPLFGHPKVREESGQTVERAIYTQLTDKTADPAFVTLVVGERGDLNLEEKKPVQMWVQNATDEPSEVSVELAEDDSKPWFARSYEFDPGAQFVLEFRTPGEYAVIVRVGSREETVKVPQSWFDCNDSGMEAVVREAKIETTGITTEMACSGVF